MGLGFVHAKSVCCTVGTECKNCCCTAVAGAGAAAFVVENHTMAASGRMLETGDYFVCCRSNQIAAAAADLADMTDTTEQNFHKALILGAGTVEPLALTYLRTHLD